MWTRSLLLIVTACSATAPAPTAQQLGKLVFEDQSLSTPPGQACADCHAERAAFRDPESSRAQSMGVVAGRFGVRNAPSLFYSGFIPPLRRDATGHYTGGLFWDGRAASLEDQIAGPLFNPLEMNNTDKASVVDKLKRGAYASMFRDLFGAAVFDDVDRGYAALAQVLAAYQRGPELAPFSSRYDRFLAGKLQLSDAEKRGLAIFEDPARGDCARCHPSRPGAHGEAPLFTTFGYANFGVPKYENNRFYAQVSNPDGPAYIDHGLAATTHDPATDGLFRIPTLRNVARTMPFSHNGYFANLPYAVEFFANRDAGSFDVPTCSRQPHEKVRCPWPAPEVTSTVEPRGGRAVLDDSELADLVAFLTALSDEVP